MGKRLTEYRPVMYQSKSRNNNNPFQVKIIKLNNKTAIVSTFRQPATEFKCRISSLYSA